MEIIKPVSVETKWINYKNIPILDFPKSKTISFNNPYLCKKDLDRKLPDYPRPIVVNNYLIVYR